VATADVVDRAAAPPINKAGEATAVETHGHDPANSRSRRTMLALVLVDHAQRHRAQCGDVRVDTRAFPVRRLSALQSRGSVRAARRSHTISLPCSKSVWQLDRQGQAQEARKARGENCRRQHAGRGGGDNIVLPPLGFVTSPPHDRQQRVAYEFMVRDTVKPRMSAGQFGCR
jgi:hypothetical protein